MQVDTEDQNKQIAKEVEGRKDIVNYFVRLRQPTYCERFRNAIMLGPQMDEVEIVDEVTSWEAFMHFVCLPWKVIFQIIPPAKTCNGWPTFVLAYLVTIGLCFLISETATAVGCLFDMCAGV